jgi:cell division protein FtsN
MSKGQAASKGGANRSSGQRGGFVLGLIVGLLLGLAVALGVALYITKAPVPFVNKLPQRTAEQDAEEASRNKNWDPNAPLASKPVIKAASGVVSPAPQASAPAAAPAVAAAPVPEASKPADRKSDAKPSTVAASAPAAEPFIYFVQIGAFTRAEDAEQQRAKAALLGFTAKVTEKEQSGRTIFRVRMGPMDTREEADGLQQKIQAAGMEANLVRAQR